MATQEVLTPEEEEKKKKKKKKTFADVTGVKFKDLILPTVLGAIGSYSRPAATAVELGLSGYRTFQAGKQLSDEQKQKEMAGQYFGDRAEQLREEQRAAGAAVEDPTASGKWLYYGQEGPTIPTPKRSDAVAGKAVQEEKFRDVMMGEAPPQTAEEAAFAGSEFGQIMTGYQDRLPFYMKPQEQQAQGIVSGIQAEAQDPTDPNVILKSIDDVRQKSIMDYKNRVQQEQERYDSEIRMSEMAQLLAGSNPAWATGLMMQQEQARISNKDAVNKLLTLEGIYSRGRQEQAGIDEKLTRMRHASEVELMRMREELEDKFYIDPSGNFIIDKKRRDKNGDPIMYDSEDYAPLAQKFNSMDSETASSQYARYVELYNSQVYKTPDRDLEEGSEEWWQREGLKKQIRLLERRLGLSRKESAVPDDPDDGEGSVRDELFPNSDGGGGGLGLGGISPAAPYNSGG